MYRIAVLPSILALSLILQPTNSSKPAHDTGAELYQECSLVLKATAENRLLEGLEVMEGVRCMDYTSGFIEALDRESKVCLSKSFEHGDMLRAYVQYMKKHPEYMDQHRSFGLYLALKTAFACPTP